MGKAPSGSLPESVYASSYVNISIFLIFRDGGATGWLTGVANTSMVNLNTHLVRLGRRNLHVLNGQKLVSSPSNGSLSVEVSIVSRIYLVMKHGCARHRLARSGRIGFTLQVMV